MNAVDDILLEVLQEADLERFADSLAEKLQVTKLEHFSHVKDSDLSAIGLSQPAIKRLKAFLKEKKHTLKRQQKGSVSKLKGGKQSPIPTRAVSDAIEETSGVTCLISKDDIKLLETLGEGSFGVVKRATWRKSNGKKVDVAVKLLRALPSDVSGANYDFSESSLQEVNAMHALRHPNLIRLYGLVLSQPIMMVTELCEGGALLDRLRSTNLPVLLIDQLLDYGVQITKGMTYLEAKLFIHRDLAARNILVSSDEKVVKIGDFGLMRTLPNREEHYVMSGQKKVPFAWCPPESLKFKKFSCASDVWAFGVTLWEMFSFGEEPWCGLNGAEILQKVTAGERLPQPDACPSSIFQLMQQCWCLDPANRPTFAALKELLYESVLVVGKCKEAQTGEGLLELEGCDRIIIINGIADSYYWYGQNIRTHKVGKFARKNIVLEEPTRRQKFQEGQNGGTSVFFEMGGGGLTSNDISRPIRGSFVHTGHGDVSGAASWGHPDKIDPIYLNNPLWIPPSSKQTNVDTERRKTQPCTDDQKTAVHRQEYGSSEDERHGIQGQASIGSLPRRNDSYHLANTLGVDPPNPSSANTSGGGSSSTGGSSGFSGDSDGQPSSRYDAPRTSPTSRPYYSIVPPPENRRMRTRTPPVAAVAPSTLTVQPLYDEVATEDPFEVPTEVKTLANRPRYSEMYANVPRLPPPPLKLPALSTVEYAGIAKGKYHQDGRQEHQTHSLLQAAATAPSTTVEYAKISKEKYYQDEQQEREKHKLLQAAATAPPSVSEDSATFPRRSTAPGYGLPMTSAHGAAGLPAVQAAPMPPPKLPFQYCSSSALSSPRPTAVAKPFVHHSPPSQPGAMDRSPSALPTSLGQQERNNALMDELSKRLHSSNFTYNSYKPIGSSSVGLDSTRFVLPVGSASAGLNSSQFLLPSPSGYVWTGPAAGGARVQSVPDINSAFSAPNSAPATGRLSANIDTHQILDLFDPLSNRPHLELIEKVRADAPFASVERCAIMLKRCQMNVQSAVKELKTEKLLDMGLAADRSLCTKALEMSNWDVNAAAEKLLG